METRGDSVAAGSRDYPIVSPSRYALVTAARDERDLIGHTIRSVLAQTQPPACWVVVIDRSTDRTAEYVRELTEGVEWVRLVMGAGEEPRSFAAKARRFNEGLELLRPMQPEFIGNLDADVSFGPDYFQRAILKFDADPRLGVVGGTVRERVGRRWVRMRGSSDSANGVTQFFRRVCLDQIGGYSAQDCGGIDSIAEIHARKLGWSVRAFEDLAVVHHRRTGTRHSGVLAARYRSGLLDWRLGNHAAFELAKCAGRVGESPVAIGALARLSGYLVGCWTRRAHVLAPDVRLFLRSEQLDKLRRLIVGKPKHAHPIALADSRG